MKNHDSASILVHDQVVAGPVLAETYRIAKGLVSEKAVTILSDENSELNLKNICKCMKVDSDEVEQDVSSAGTRDKDLNDETEDGFTLLAKLRLDRLDDSSESSTSNASTKDGLEEDVQDDTQENAQEVAHEDSDEEDLLAVEALIQSYLDDESDVDAMKE